MRKNGSSWLVVAPAALLLACAPAWAGSRVERRAEDGSRAFLGVELCEETEHPAGGARVFGVVGDTAAERAGLREDDIVVSVDGRTVRGPAALGERLREHAPGDRVSLEIVRDGRSQTLDVVLGERPRPVHWHARASERPRLGVQLVGTTPELREHLGGESDRGVLVGKVLDDSPAERGGVEVGDLIVAVSGRPVADVGDLIEALAREDAGSLAIEVVRDGRKRSLTVELPPDDGAATPRASVAPHARWTPAAPPAPAAAPLPPAPPAAPLAAFHVAPSALPAPPAPPVPPARRPLAWI